VTGSLQNKLSCRNPFRLFDLNHQNNESQVFPHSSCGDLATSGPSLVTSPTAPSAIHAVSGKRDAIRQQVDDYIVKPANIPALVNTIESKLASPPRQRQLPPPKRVAMILQEHLGRIEELWLSAVEKDGALSRVTMNKEQRRNHLRGILEEVIRAAQSYSGEEIPAHKRSFGGYDHRRDLEGYTPSMMLAEFCVLRRVIAQTVQENLLAVNLSYLVPDLSLVNQSLDDQAQAALVTLSEYMSGPSGSPVQG
jgi:hypothetical protein